MRKAKLILILTVLHVGVALGANETPFLACAGALALAGHPKVEIHIVGEVHAPEPAGSLVKRAKAGEILFMVEGAGFGATKTVHGPGDLGIDINANGPVFGIEHPLATMIQDLHFMYFNLVLYQDTPPEIYYRQPENQAALLRFVMMAGRHPAYFNSVLKEEDAASIETLTLLKKLVALGKTEAVSKAIEDGEFPNDLDDHAAALRTFMEVGMHGLELQYPVLTPWFEIPRASINGEIEKVVEAVAELLLVRNFFICQFIARVVAKHAHEGKRFVLLVGVAHVADVVRVLEAEFNGVPNVHITYDENRGALNPANAVRDEEMLRYLRNRAAPSISR